jgi:E3 ubiquitin-protein ligase DOA10
MLPLLPCPTTPIPLQEPKICRICWGESDAEPGGQLISPCNCSGTSGNIHVRCLRSWQRSLRDRGMSAAARRCEVRH